jgi:alkylation response protein AidB-like acyl-CoA dehydrogenase
MDLLPSREQEQIVVAVSDFLTRGSTFERLSASDPVRARELWEACADQGWFDLGIPEEFGGLGLTSADEALVFEQIGRHVTPAAFVAGVMAGRLAVATGDPGLVDGLKTGQVMVGFGRSDHSSLVADRVSGLFHILDAGDADVIIVLFRDSVVLLNARDCTEAQILRSIDPSVRIRTTRFDRATPIVLAPAAEEIALAGSVLVAASLSGTAAACLEMSLSHVLAREQFGRLIGSFQAVKHRCADMAVRAEAARALTLFAAVSIAENSNDAWRLVSSARALAARTAIANSRANIANHGALGFTDEHGAHLFLKRAHLMGGILGTTERHDARVIAQGDGTDEKPWW